MKKLLILGTVLTLFAGCSKSDSGSTCPYTESSLVASAGEIAYLQSYAATNHPAAVQHPSGIFYEILTPSTGATPNICSRVTVRYTGTLIPSGTKFDENTSGITFSLGNLIVGWQKGIPLLKKGGYILLLVPPSLAYGASGSGTIPGNAYLKFYIELLDVS